jgi:hypothetical protein
MILANFTGGANARRFPKLDAILGNSKLPVLVWKFDILRCR